MDKHLFLDVDGVLANWLKATHALKGVPYTEGVWPYARGPEGWYFYRELGWTSKYLFEGQADRSFWANFEWTTDGKEIRDLCEDVFDGNITLLTAPFDADGVVDGRKDWIKREMPGYEDRTLIGKCKEAIPMGNPNAILIDDWEENILSWQRAGGTGILLPRPYNSNEMFSSCPVTILEQELETIFEGKNE